MLSEVNNININLITVPIDTKWFMIINVWIYYMVHYVINENN